MRYTIVALLTLFITPLGAQTRDPLPVPDIPGYRTLKCDFHMHTVFSDGEVWPTTRVEEAWRDGLDAIAITDHSGYNPHEEDVRADLRRPHAIARGLGERLGLIVIPGVEVMEGNIHCNALFVTEPNAFNGLGLLEALRKARAQDAFVFWNHPGWKQTPEWFPLIASAHDEHLLQGMELVNGLTFYPEAYPWIAERKLTIISNSDIHAPVSAEYRARTRPITLVFARAADAAGVREALFARRTAAWMGGDVWGSEDNLRSLVQNSIQPENKSLKFASGVRGATLQIRNRSAIPYRLRVLHAAEWLEVAAGEVPAESTAAFSLGLLPEAPAGTHNVELQFEITNLHLAPGRNLTWQAPVRVEITK
ncbi:MAG TPA: PHP domain-containing protein [Bryobacteraceae bacterium]